MTLYDIIYTVYHIKGLKGKSLHIYFRHSNVKRYELALMSHVEIFPSDLLLYMNHII